MGGILHVGFVRVQNGLVRVVVTRIERDGTMQRRMVDTAQQGDPRNWEDLAARALAVRPPYRPVPGTAVYHIGVDGSAVEVGEYDLEGPLRDLVTVVLAMGSELLAWPRCVVLAARVTFGRVLRLSGLDCRAVQELLCWATADDPAGGFCGPGSHSSTVARDAPDGSHLVSAGVCLGGHSYPPAMLPGRRGPRCVPPSRCGPLGCSMTRAVLVVHAQSRRPPSGRWDRASCPRHR